jgi:hypothetical protein
MRDIVRNPDGTVTISAAKFKHIEDQLDWLECLEAAGVDNWQGIEEAIHMRHEEGDDDDG